jgi:hypothetical protein
MVLLLATIMGYVAETISNSSLKFRHPFFFFYPDGIQERENKKGKGWWDRKYKGKEN